SAGGGAHRDRRSEALRSCAQIPSAQMPSTQMPKARTRPGRRLYRGAGPGCQRFRLPTHCPGRAWDVRRLARWKAAMGPSLLNPLFASIRALPGVGPKVETLFGRLTGRDDAPRLIDLLFHLPTGAIDRRARPKLRDVVPGTVVTVAVTVDRHRPAPPGRSRAPYLIYASDDTGDLILTYFNARRDYLERLFPVGEQRYVSGTTALYDGHLQMVHPDRVVDEAGFKQLPLVEPVYPLTEGLGALSVRKAVDGAVAKLP